MNAVASPNFAFLAQHDELLVRYAMLAERYVFDDPNSSLIKQRQLAEALARRVAASIGVDHDDFVTVLSAIGTSWWEGDEAVHSTARYLGFKRTGDKIDNAIRSVINGLIRQDRIERDGSRIRRL